VIHQLSRSVLVPIDCRMLSSAILTENTHHKERFPAPFTPIDIRPPQRGIPQQRTCRWGVGARVAFVTPELLSLLLTSRMDKVLAL
jgi:hypothetical protein